MISRTRLAKLERQIQASPALTAYTPEAKERAESARQRLPDCTDPEEAMWLIDGQPPDVYSALLRLVSHDLLKQMHAIKIDKAPARERIYGYTMAELRAMPAGELVELHRATLGDSERRLTRRQRH